MRTRSRGPRGWCGRSSVMLCSRKSQLVPFAPDLRLTSKSRTVIVKDDEHDVFGDGTVILKAAAGHTPGHQVVYVKLAQTGGVVLSGDLYHYPQERTLGRLPVAEFSEDQTRLARQAVEAFLARTGAQLWIQHDFAADAKLKKAPAYYE